MRTYTVVLDADYTPKSIVYLLTLATAIPQIATANDANPTDHEARKAQSRHVHMKVFAEATNDGGDATHSSARIGFESTSTPANFKTSAVLVTAHGTPLLPGLEYDFHSAGAAGIYDLRTVALSGKTGDTFQIHVGTI